MYHDIESIQTIVEEKLEGKNISGRRLVMEVQRLENLFKQTKKDSKEYKTILSSLYDRYMLLNENLGLICREMNYPERQNEWFDDGPLQAMQDIFKGIQNTEWYRNQIKMRTEWRDHPWYAISLN